MMHRSAHLKRRGSSAHALVIALVCAALICLGFPSPAAQAANATVQNDAQLKAAIRTAGTTPSTITIDGTFAGGAVVPAGADITFVGINGGTLQQGGGNVAIEVDAGGKATLGAGLTVRGNDATALSYGLIDVRGEFTMLDGATVSGSQNLGSETGAITVEGADARFIMSGGAIHDNRVSDDSVERAAGGVYVARGGTADLNGGAIYENGTSAYTGKTGLVAGGVFVNAGGTVNVAGTEIYQNDGQQGGGIAAYSLTKHSPATVNLRDNAVISANRATNGGGIAALGNTRVTMSGGSVDANVTGGSGAGVSVQDLCFAADDQGNSKDGQCAEASVAPSEWAASYPAEFTMTGGEIRDNTASTTGGGISISSTKVTLSGGSIAGNSATLQGGGVYVTSDKYGATIKNAVVTKNAAATQGGGIWLAPSGTTALNASGGVAIGENSAEIAGDDIAAENYGTAFHGELTTGPRAYGGAETTWYQDASTARFDPATASAYPPQTFDTAVTIHSELDADGLALASARASLTISDNRADRGAGIASAGDITFGRNIDTTLTVALTWQDNQGKPLATAAQPESVELELMQVIDGQPHRVDSFTVERDSDWKIALHEFPVQDAAPQFVVSAPTLSGYETTVTKLSGSDASGWTLEVTSAPAATATATSTSDAASPAPAEPSASAPAISVPATTAPTKPPVATATATPGEFGTTSPSSPDAEVIPPKPSRSSEATSESTDADGDLPGTGADVLPLTIGAAAVLLAGIGLSSWRRRSSS